MASSINPAEPQTGIAVSKAAQRANWLAAKNEIEALQAQLASLIPNLLSTENNWTADQRIIKSVDRARVWVERTGGARAAFSAGVTNVNVGATSNHPLDLRTNDLLRIQVSADGSVIVGSPAGGHKGPGRLNVEEIYEANNRVLTEAAKATEAQATLLTDNATWMTPLRTGQAIAGLTQLGGMRGLKLIRSTAARIQITVGSTISDPAVSTPHIMVLTEAFNKDINGAWTIGSSANGLFTGSSPGTNTWWHVFLIRRDSDGLIDAGFDTSPAAANRPAGWTAWRRLGSIRTDGSSQIRTFLHVLPDLFLWDAPPLDVSVTDLTTAEALYTISAPPGIVSLARLNAVTTGSDRQVYIYRPGTTSAAPSTSAAPLYSIGGGSGGGPNRGSTFVEVITDTSSQIAARSGTASTVLRVATTGWRDLHRVSPE